MKLLTAFAALLVSLPALAALRLDCSDLTPKQLALLKRAPVQDPCLGQGTSIVAIASTGVLYTCEDSRTVERYDISIGRSGFGKTREGDLKTPLGTYLLGQPKESERFGLFIPVGYPTREQKANGFTGSDVGIHGPDRFFACAGALNVSLNWTQGCLAVADDRFIVEIGQFVKAHSPLAIHILDSDSQFGAN
jgi:hypothetical protein